MSKETYKEQLEREAEEMDEKFRMIEEKCSRLEEQAEIENYRYEMTGDDRYAIRVNLLLDKIQELEDYQRYLEEEVYIEDDLYEDKPSKAVYLMEEESDDSVEVGDVPVEKK